MIRVSLADVEAGKKQGSIAVLESDRRRVELGF
jgi:hypothetical protein